MVGANDSIDTHEGSRPCVARRRSLKEGSKHSRPCRQTSGDLRVVKIQYNDQDDVDEIECEQNAEKDPRRLGGKE